jgi:ubiquinone/menaquinone biosynthesis C-methylase UbiE
MVSQARARNATAIRDGRVDLRRGSVESLPFADDAFDKALAINSMQVWPDAVAGLRAIRRVMKPGVGSPLALRAIPGSRTGAWKNNSSLLDPSMRMCRREIPTSVH